MITVYIQPCGSMKLSYWG